MSLTYEYGLQQRPMPQYVAHLFVTDPSPSLVAVNYQAMVALQQAALSYQMSDRGNLLEPPINPSLPLTGVVVFEFIHNDATGQGSVPLMMGYTLSQAHLDELVKQFNSTVKASLTSGGGKHHKGA